MEISDFKIPPTQECCFLEVQIGMARGFQMSIIIAQGAVKLGPVKVKGLKK